MTAETRTPEEARRAMAALTARSRPTRRPPTRGYSRFVRILKVTLPLAALGLLGAVVAWPQIGSDVPPPPPVVAQAEGPTMTDPRFHGTDSRNRPFSVTAERAVQAVQAGSPVALEKPDAEVTLGDGTWVQVSARTGQFDQPNQMLRLDGDVTVFHDSGYQMQGEQLQVKLEEGRLWSDAPVRGQGPNGEIEAEGLQIVDRGRTVVFTGKSRLVLRPDESGKTGASQP
ncbi:MAG TPA: LPS export ABC transporter periplasmic protein LptC [Alphaproteobacteria bacterium]|nr:LPS export ABC transporter periplasmic protein LptC [Alphaproteobacteria bacterium]